MVSASSSSPPPPATQPRDPGAELFQLVYVSTAVVPFEEGELLELLTRSRVNNARLGVTGLLLYHEGNIMQALEGPEAAVKALHTKIEADARHTGCLTLIRERGAERAFPDWAMGFRNLRRDVLEQTPGYSDFLRPRGVNAVPRDPARAWRLLMSFRERLR